jgi:hypothetical protein
MLNTSTKTKAKAALKLYNQINSYLLEQEFEELAGNPIAKMSLKQAAQCLAKIIRREHG